jgi:hypothetical protein
MTPEELDRLEAVARKATPGPWDSEGSTYVYAQVPGGRPNGEGIACFGCYTDSRKTNAVADAAYAASANPATVLALIALCRAQSARIAEMEKERSDLVSLLQRAYTAGHRNGWEEGETTNEVMNDIQAWLSDWKQRCSMTATRSAAEAKESSHG